MKRKTKLRLEKKSDVRRSILNNKVFRKFGKWDHPIFGNDMPLNEMIDLLIEYRELLIAEYDYRVRTDPFFDDFRTGEETYGYNSDEEIRNNLFYISDRWIAQFRMKWMIDLIYKNIH